MGQGACDEVLTKLTDGVLEGTFIMVLEDANTNRNHVVGVVTEHKAIVDAAEPTGNALKLTRDGFDRCVYVHRLSYRLRACACCPP